MEHSFQHEGEAVRLGIDADRPAAKPFNGWAIRSADQTEEPAMEAHEDKKIGAVIVFDIGDDVIRTGMADIAPAVFKSLANV
jgi:hypothetical protein